MALPPGSVWLIKRQGVPEPNHKIRVTEVPDEVTFKAEYVDVPGNNSVFTGELWARESQIINIKQHDQNNGYVSFQTGLRKKSLFGEEYYEGSWYDVAGHHGGNFKLEPVS